MKPTSGVRFDSAKVPQRMRWAREHRGLSRPKLAKRVGMSKDQLRKKEDGTNPFYLGEIRKICDVLEAPYLYPFLEWEAARLADKLLGWPETPP